MPIYEFYCPDCHTVYSFFSRRVETERTPACPKCARKKLERQVSRFAFSKGRPDPSESDVGGEADPFAGMDEAKMEKAMMELASQAEGIDENDPRAMAQMMRKVLDSTGMPLNAGMEEAIRRLEAGEDPDKIDEDLGDTLDSDNPFASSQSPLVRSIKRRLNQAPSVDPHVYDM